MQKIVVVDYGMGNIGSLVNMFKRIGTSVHVSPRPEDISSADKILLPGVGAFDAAMTRIDALGLRKLLVDRANKDCIPFLGVCLGMQLLMEESEEGSRKGLGLIPGLVKRFDPNIGIKVPHMGWNTTVQTKPSALTDHFDGEARFYFVHSYYVKAADRADALLTTHHGLTFDAGVSRKNIYGFQFHPEKSHRFGMRLLKAFVDLPC